MVASSIPPRWEQWLQVGWHGVSIHYHEIALKGGNRHQYVVTLQQNLERALAPYGGRVRILSDRLEVTPRRTRPTPEWICAVAHAASQVFGVAFAAPVLHVGRAVDKLVAVGEQVYRMVAQSGASIGVRVRRVAKTYPLTSTELQKEIGRELVARTQAPVNLGTPDVELSYRIYKGSAIVLGPKIPGVGGLPLGVTGHVLTLLSGGIDSAVAAWLVMRRGCTTDFLHFHTFPSADEVKKTKIVRLVEKLMQPHRLHARLVLAPYHAFQVAVVLSRIPPSLELVLFRRFMVRVAARIAQQYHCQALVTGDNLAQVASQTLENLCAVDDASELAIFRPLLTYNKQETIALAERLGTYELSREPYKDCCSLIACHPKTRPKLQAVQNADLLLPIDAIIERTLTETAVWELDTGEQSSSTASSGNQTPDTTR